jgi:TM2 domain-containing membrane protein YozV
MNCAIHTDVPAAAYCRTCGKALCETCKRDVKGVIYCEDCIAAHVEGTLPAAQPAGGTTTPVQPSFGPSPGLAGVLAGFLPFGIGQVYNRQYGKGLAYMLTFALLIWGASTSGDTLGPFFGIAIAFFYFYQIIDAVRSARAIQLGQPAPDPFGLNTFFGFSEEKPKWTLSGAPIGAIVLIGLGVLFLLHNIGLFAFFHIGRFWPLALIALGVGIFQQRRSACPCIRCRTSGIMAPAVLVTLGILFQLSTLHVKDFDATWPLLLIVIGVVKILQTSGPTTGHIGPDASDQNAHEGVQNV